MKYIHKCVCHSNRKADRKFRGLYFCSDCLKEVRRSRGYKNRKPIAVWSEKHIFSIGNTKVYQDILVKL